MLLDVLAAIAVLATAFAAVVLFAVRERVLVDSLRRSAAMDAALTEGIERLRARPFASLRVGADQPVTLEGLDDRLLDGVVCRLDVEPYRPDTPDLLRVTVRVIWQPPFPVDGPPVVRSRTTFVARRTYEEGR